MGEESKAMLHASAAALCLVFLLNSFEFLKCRSTAGFPEYQVGLMRACLRGCGFLAADVFERSKSKLDTKEVRNNFKNQLLCRKGCDMMRGRQRMSK